jgi:hypothetical protein
MESELAGETEVLSESLPQFYFAHHKSHMTWHGIEFGPPRWEAGDYVPEVRHSRKRHSAGIAASYGPVFYSRQGQGIVFVLHSVQTGSGVHPASYSMGAGALW